MSILPNRSTTNVTPAVLAVAHPPWCNTSDCHPTPDWDRDGTGFFAHHARLLDGDGLPVEVAQGEAMSPQGDVLQVEHASRAADHILALVVARGPTYGVTPELHDATVELVHAVVAALVARQS
jgi:hypothetical protein